MLFYSKKLSSKQIQKEQGALFAKFCINTLKWAQEPIMIVIKTSGT